MNEALLIQSDPDLSRLVAAALESSGWSVRRTASAAEGWESALDALPSLIVIEQQLPDGNGIALSRRLSGHSTLARARVLLIADAFLEAPRELDTAAGRVEYLVEPFTVQELLRRVSSLLAKPLPG